MFISGMILAIGAAFAIAYVPKKYQSNGVAVFLALIFGAGLLVSLYGYFLYVDERFQAAENNARSKISAEYKATEASINIADMHCIDKPYRQDCVKWKADFQVVKPGTVDSIRGTITFGLSDDPVISDEHYGK